MPTMICRLMVILPSSEDRLCHWRLKGLGDVLASFASQTVVLARVAMTISLFF